MKALEAVHKLLFDNTALTAEVGTNIAYARAPITASWPCIHYFEVSEAADRDMDFKRLTVQVSAWSQDKYQALRLRLALLDQFNRLTDTNVAITGGFLIHRADIVDSGALPSDDKLLYGSFVRFVMKWRDGNIKEA